MIGKVIKKIGSFFGSILRAGKWILFIFLLILLLFVFKKFLIDNLYLENTDTNIIAVKDVSLLKTYQMNIDIFANYNGEYIGIVPFTVQVRFDLSKNNILKFKNNKFKVIIPEPEIIVSKRDKMIWVKNSEDDAFLKEFWSYGEVAAKYIAVKRNIFSESVKSFRNIFEKFSKVFGIDLEFDESRLRELKFSKIVSRKCSIKFELPDEVHNVFKNFNVYDNTLKDYCLDSESKDGRFRLIIYPVIVEKMHDEKENPELKQFSLLNPEVSYTMRKFNDRAIRYYYNIADKKIILEVVAESSKDLKRNFKYYNFIASVIEDAYFAEKAVHDFAGNTKELWDNASLDEKTRYICGSIFGMEHKIECDLNSRLLAYKSDFEFLNKDEDNYDVFQDLEDYTKENDIFLVLYERYPGIFGIGERHDFWLFYEVGDVVYISVDRVNDFKDFIYGKDVDFNDYKDFSIYEAFYKRGSFKNDNFCISTDVCFGKKLSQLINKFREKGFLVFYK